MAALSSFIVTRNDWYAHDCIDYSDPWYRRSSCCRMAASLYTCTSIEKSGVVRFLGAMSWQQRISTKKRCPCTVNIACHIKQSSKTTSFVGTLSWRWRSWKSSVRTVRSATTRILRRMFPGTCEMDGQVFTFVWRLCWKINVCMSLYPFVSFRSWFVTYLLTFPRTLYTYTNGCYRH